MTDTYLRQGDGGLFRVEAGQQHAFACECGRTHLLSFDIEGDQVLVTIGGDRRQSPARRMVKVLHDALVTAWPRR